MRHVYPNICSAEDLTKIKILHVPQHTVWGMVRQNILALSLTCIVAISGIIFLDTFCGTNPWNVDGFYSFTCCSVSSWIVVGPRRLLKMHNQNQSMSGYHGIRQRPNKPHKHRKSFVQQKLKHNTVLQLANSPIFIDGLQNFGPNTGQIRAA